MAGLRGYSVQVFQKCSARKNQFFRFYIRGTQPRLCLYDGKKQARRMWASEAKASRRPIVVVSLAKTVTSNFGRERVS